MRKRFLLEGDYQDQAVWIGVEFQDEAISLALHVYSKKDFKKEVMQQWIRGEADLPEATNTFMRGVSDENLLPEDLRVVNVGKVRDIEIEWADHLMITRMFEGFDGDLVLLQEKVANLQDYSQEVFDECADFWNRVLQFKQEHSKVTQEDIDKYKLHLDVLFEALKALRKDFKKEQKGKADEAKKNLLLKLEILKDKWEEKPNSKFTIDRLKEVRKELNGSGLKQGDYAEIDQLINDLFDTVGQARKQVNHEKVNKRITDLEAIVEKMQKSIDWEKRTMAKEEKNKNFANQAFQVKLIDAKIEMIKSRLVEKEEKLKDIKSTLASLQKKA